MCFAVFLIKIVFAFLYLSILKLFCSNHIRVWKTLIRFCVHPIKRKKEQKICLFPKVDRYSRYFSQTMFLSCFFSVNVSTTFCLRDQNFGQTILIESGSQVQMTVTSLLPWVLVARRKRKKEELVKNGKSEIDVQTDC